MSQFDHDALARRALSAYFRKTAVTGGVPLQPATPEVVERNGLHYVVLSNVNGLLAVYRVRTVNGAPMLKGLKRWPAELGAKQEGAE